MLGLFMVDWILASAIIDLLSMQILVASSWGCCIAFKRFRNYMAWRKYEEVVTYSGSYIESATISYFFEIHENVVSSK